MTTRIIPVSQLHIGQTVTDPDILRDYNEPDPLKVVKLEEQGDAAVTVVFEGLRGRHKDTFGVLFALEAQIEPTPDSPKLKKLDKALEELLGFARRNEERALKAAEYARTHRDPQSPEQAYKLIWETEARHHEAVRVRQVIEERVKEARS